MRLHNTISIVFLFITILNGCSLFSSEENVVAITLLPKVNNQFQPTTVWSRSVGSGSGVIYSNLHPAWQGNRVFAADRSGMVKAFDANSGKEIWSTNLSICTSFFSCNRPAMLSGGIATIGKRIYIGSELAKVYAINEQDGSIYWETTVAGEAMSTPVGSDGIILIHTSNGLLQALNEDDGAIKWTINIGIQPLTLRGESSPRIAFGAAIIGGDDGRVSAVMVNHGQLIWQQRISQPIGTTKIFRINDVQTTPVIANSIVYAIAYNGNFAALDLHSGQIIWSREIGSTTNLLIVGNRIYLVDQDDRVIAMDANSGIILWYQNELIHHKLTSPVLYNGYIVTGDSKGYLYWINTYNGQFVAQQKVDVAGFLADPIVAGDKLIVQAKNGQIYAIRS